MKLACLYSMPPLAAIASSSRTSRLSAHATLALLFSLLSFIPSAESQAARLDDGVLTLPYVVSDETTYSAELTLVPGSSPARFELIAANPVTLTETLDISTFADGELFVTDISVGGLVYWVELALVTADAAKPVFEVRRFGVQGAALSDTPLGGATEPQWQRLPGSASDIGVGADGSVWAIGTDERSGGYGIYQWLGSSWQRVDGGALRIDVDPTGRPWIVNDSHSIYRREGDRWERVAGNARDIGIGSDGTVWVTSGGGTYRFDDGDWVGVRGSGVRIDVDPHGIPWVISHSNDIHQLIAGRWVRRPGAARDIGVGGDGSVWIVGTSDEDGGHKIYRFSGGGWNRVPGSSRQLSVDPSGLPWIVNSDGDIYRGQ